MKIKLLGDYNIQAHEKKLLTFLDEQGMHNLIKQNTCFKSSGTCIDLILTNRKRSFMNTNSYETGDHHHMIYTMLRTTFTKSKPRKVFYRDYKYFDYHAFKYELTNVISNSNNSNYSEFENYFTQVLDIHAPKKCKMLRSNHKPHVNKILSKAIMKRSQLKNMSNRTGKLPDKLEYKKQRNLVVDLNRKMKLDYFENFNISSDCKPFWVACKPYFTDKGIRSSSNIMLLENDDIVIKDEEIAIIFNEHFGSIIEALDLSDWRGNCFSDNNRDMIGNIIHKYRSHPSIQKIKNKIKIAKSFNFVPVTIDEIKIIIRDLKTNKASAGEIPLKLLKESNFIFEKIVECVNGSN